MKTSHMKTSHMKTSHMKTRGVIYDAGTVYGTGLIRLRAQ
jgi:hypothetical protein